MKYIYIGTDEVRLFLDCGSMNIYKIPLGVSLPSKDEFIYSIVYGCFVFAVPLTYKLTQSSFIVAIEVLVSIFLALLILMMYQKRTQKDYERWITEKPYVKENNYDAVMNTYHKYVVKNILGCFVLTAIIIWLLIGSMFFFYYFEPPRYRLLLALNAPSGLMIILGSLRPVKTIKYYLHIKRLIKNL